VRLLRLDVTADNAASRELLGRYKCRDHRACSGSVPMATSVAASASPARSMPDFPATLDHHPRRPLMLTFTLGTFAIALNHLLLISALALATFVGWRVAKRGGENPESVLFSLFLMGMLAARVSFVAVYWMHYRNDPWQIIDLRDGGFLAWPGVIALVLPRCTAPGAARDCAARWALAWRVAWPSGCWRRSP
jgi:hypothetical protein